MAHISTDKSRLNPALIHAFLTESYWAKGISYERILKRIANSLCFGVYDERDGAQIGFARVITDYESFAYLADVFIVPSHRGQGLSKTLMQYIFTYPDLPPLRRWLLATADAHGLYAQFGFEPMQSVARWMEKTNLQIYTTQESQS
jgi:GNAT superfamily N-acetyltransferase